MSDGFAPLHRPSTGFLRRSQARTGLSKALHQSIKYTLYITNSIKRKNNDDQQKIK